MKRVMLVSLVGVLGIYAADTREEPVGLVIAAASSKVLRANTETPLATRAGDILFSGDPAPDATEMKHLNQPRGAQAGCLATG